MKIKILFILKILLLILTVFLLFNIKNYRSENYFKEQNSRSTKLSKAELAFFNAEFEFLKIRNPYTNSIPENARQRELEFSSHIPTRESFYDKSGNTVLSQNWNSTGQSNVAGRMLAIEFDINNENIIHAGSASGGIWKSIDKGLSWIRTSSPNEIQGVTCIAQDTRKGKNNIWYYGTGELLSTTDRRISTASRTIGLGNGIYKSTDNGSSWYPLASTQTIANGKLSEVFQGVWNIKINPIDSTNDVVYAACYGAIMKSTDGGNTWSVALGDMDNKSFSSDIAITSNGIIYAALSSFSTTSFKPKKTGIWKSTNAGVDWIYITPFDFPNDTRIIKLALAPSNENVIYALTEVPQYSKSIQAFYPSYHGFWKYTFNQEVGIGSWEKRTSFIPGNGTDNYNTNSLNTLGGYAIVIKVKPDDENVLFLGGTSLFRTMNGFKDTTTNMNIGGYPYYWTREELHPDMHGLAFLPSNPNILYVANDGGIQVTDNCLNNIVKWRYQINGLMTTQFYSISMDHKGFNDGLLFGGLQDNASQILNSKDPNKPWITVYGGDGMSTGIVNNEDILIGSTYYGSLFTTNKEGKNFTYQTPGFLTWDCFSFYTYFTLDIDNSKTLYLAAKNLIWRKNDISISASDTSKVNEGWEEISKNKIGFNSFITALKANSSRLYIGTSNGKVYRLDEPRTNDNTPIDITGKEFPFYGFVSCVEIDPDDADKAFVVFSNYSVLSIFYTTDGGINWTKQGGNLEGDFFAGTLGPSIRYVKILRYNGTTIYFAGTSTGLYLTTELAGSNTIWVKEGSEQIGNVIIDYIDSRSSDGMVAVATQGSGVYTAYYTTTSNFDNSEPYYFSLNQNNPNPASNYTEISFILSKDGFTKLNLYDFNGNLVKNILSKHLISGKHSVKINVSNLRTGTYYYNLLSGENKQTKKMIVLQ